MAEAPNFSRMDCFVGTGHRVWSKNSAEAQAPGSAIFAVNGNTAAGDG
jgi:hypothetical protein